jgi:YaiO family outer membrane protein
VEPDGFTLDLAGDRAGVSLGASHTSWWSGRAQLTWRRTATGGALVAVEPLRRFDRTDTTFIAAGWRHLGPWSVYGEAGGTPHADFHYRRSAEVEVFRRVGGSAWVPHVGYRFFAFPGQDVSLIFPAVTRYGARSELLARVSFARNATTGVRSTAAFARGRYDLGPRVTLGGGVAVGERIFDVTALPRDPAPGWVAFAEARVAAGKGNSVGVLVRLAEEGSTFDQAALGFTYRRAF